jgi:hypothetical protein
VIVVMTHWHEDDLAGRLMKDMADGGEQWVVIKMPAVAVEDEHWRVGPWSWARKRGEALWPERWPIGKLRSIERRSARWWSALYQQEPTPAGGLLAYSRSVAGSRSSRRCRRRRSRSAGSGIL